MSATTPTDRASRMWRLTNVSRALTNASSSDSMLALTLDCAIDLLSADKAVLMLNGDDGLLHVRASRGLDADLVERFREPLDETVVQRLEALFGPSARDRFLGVPLVVRGRVIGLLAVDRGRSSPVSEDEEWLLSALADQASIALDAASHDERRSALEEQLAQMTESRANTHRALQIAGHDLRTPLNAMQGYVELLRAGVFGPVNDRQAELLERVQVVGRHFQSVLDNVLEMARLANGALNIKIAVVSIENAVRDASMMLTPAAKKKGVTITCNFDRKPMVYADPDRLRQVVLHLLDNAVKYTPIDSDVIVTTDILRENGTDWGTIRVQDAGPGIPPEKAEEAFAPYRRLYTRKVDDPGGTGLGLSIARSLTELMGGSINVLSNTEPGATFRICLPLADSSDSD